MNPHAVRLRHSDKQLEFDHIIYFGICRLFSCNQLQTRSESIEQNAWSLIVNYQGEQVTTDVVVQTKRFSLEAPISGHLPLFNLATQGLRDGNAVG